MGTVIHSCKPITWGTWYQRVTRAQDLVTTVQSDGTAQKLGLKNKAVIVRWFQYSHQLSNAHFLRWDLHRSWYSMCLPTDIEHYQLFRFWTSISVRQTQVWIFLIHSHTMRSNSLCRPRECHMLISGFVTTQPSWKSSVSTRLPESNTTPVTWRSTR